MNGGFHDNSTFIIYQFHCPEMNIDVRNRSGVNLQSAIRGFEGMFLMAQRLEIK